jgi:hypothetical protein
MCCGFITGNFPRNAPEGITESESRSPRRYHERRIALWRTATFARIGRQTAAAYGGFHRNFNDILGLD